MEHDAGTTQVRWLVAGAFGLGERGKMVRLTRADFNEVFSARKIAVTATVHDAIGGGDTRSFELSASSLKELTLKHVMRSVPELGEIAAMADKVAKLKDPTVESVGAIVGEGKLLDAAKALLSPDDAPAASAADAGEATGDSEAIFDKAEVAKPTAKSAIDMFIRASSSSSKKKARPAARQLRDLVEEVAWGMAKDVLAADSVRAVEESWRGVRFLVMECPKDSAMEVCLLETDPEHVLEDLENRTRGDEVEEPDCIFIPHDYATTEGLAGLADHAESNLIPIVVGAHPTLFGATEPYEIPGAFEAIERANNDEVPAWATTWDELRMLEPTRWLTAVTNRVVLHAEGKGAASRVVFGSGVWAVAAMLARSYRNTGGFAKIFGKAGGLSAPANHTIAAGPHKDTAAPTEAFYAISPCETLAKNGVLAVGSARNSDVVALLKAPVVRGAPDAVPLPAQILTGRVVRFASWVKPQLPEGCDSSVANELFEAAASVFLFPGQESAAHVQAAVTNIEGEAHVVVRAAANPAIASIPFEIAFPLPLNWSVPAPEAPTGEASPVAQAQAAAGDAAEVKAETGGGAPEGGVGLGGSSIGFDASMIDDKK